MPQLWSPQFLSTTKHQSPPESESGLQQKVVHLGFPVCFQDCLQSHPDTVRRTVEFVDCGTVVELVSLSSGLSMSSLLSITSLFFSPETRPSRSQSFESLNCMSVEWSSSECCSTMSPSQESRYTSLPPGIVLITSCASTSRKDTATTAITASMTKRRSLRSTLQ